MSSVYLAAVVLGPMAESYAISRSTGMFVRGGWTTTSSQIGGYGVVSVASPEDLDMIPEMDRVTGAMVFHSFDRVYLTEIDQGDFGVPTTSAQRVSDIILWNNLQWRVMHVSPYPNHGFWKCIAVRLQGN